MSQSTCYPSQALTAGIDPNASPMCTGCNTYSPHTVSSACTSTSTKNSSDNTADCSAYCNTTGANNVCSSSQAYCTIGKQLVVDHADVDLAPVICLVKDEIIYRNWTSDYWNTLTGNLTTAGEIGFTASTGGVNPAQVLPEDIITAEIYNSMANRISDFNSSVANVNVDDVIYAAHAIAIDSGFNSMAFDTSICDICNAGVQGAGVCDCNCDCACSCNCGCSCPCSCSSGGRL